jgi:aspartyl-tRNA(Asn)/glutamyl-tRNA(Gln) amidotransferase subunit A
MRKLPADPFVPGGIAAFAERLRLGEITAEAAASAYVERIELLEPRLQAFEHVAAELALETARSLDRLLAAGTDLGPLMGVPVAIKDLYAVEGMPTTAGSNVDVTDIIGTEGSFVKKLKRAGCVILGKTKTVEFALGAGNHHRGTPWNPWDGEIHRAPGGSSSGSAVAVAAGLCAFAIGSDTGGSVRIPAALCGTFGLKTTVGLWPLDGVFPMAPSFDTIGPLTASAADAALVFAVLEGTPVAAPPPRGLRLGRPTHHFFDELEAEVETCMTAALAALEEAGIEMVPMEFPEADEVTETFPIVSPTELLSVLGRERFEAIRERMDRDVAARTANGLEVTAEQYIRLKWRQVELCHATRQRMQGLDGVVGPTLPMVAVRRESFDDAEFEHEYHRVVARNTRPGNVLGLCATTTPVQAFGASLPVGLQVLCDGFCENHALAVARTIEEIVGPPPRPDPTPFLD